MIRADYAEVVAARRRRARLLSRGYAALLAVAMGVYIAVLTGHVGA